MDQQNFQSLTGMTKMTEPQEVASKVTHPASSSSAVTTTSAIPRLIKQPSLSSIPKKPSNSQPTSATNSPVASRESSPSRPQLKTRAAGRSGAGRPRNNSSKDNSPVRSMTAPASNSVSASTTRALSSTTTPNLPASKPDAMIKAPVPQKPSLAVESRDVPRWPISPRLKSPPPVNKSAVASRKPDTDVPIINVQRSTPTEPKHPAVEGDDLLAGGTRTPARGVSGVSSTLETVQEISQPPTPALGLVPQTDGATEEKQNPMDQAFSKTLDAKLAKAANESGNESGEKKNEAKVRAASATPAPTRPSTTSLAKAYTIGPVGRGKPLGEGSTKNMIVETETVSTIPHVAVGGGAGGMNGSLRAKPSTETIRPKKEKKKTTRKAPSIVSGTGKTRLASSKADIFEAQIASAVDEADSSDSDETFVYESNPPEANDRPRRFHSRTPSATSMASQLDQRAHARSIHGPVEGHGVAPKKSMKFANSYSSNVPGNGEDDSNGTVRSALGTGRGTVHHHHIGRWGRHGGNGHPSLFDNESPFPNVTRSKLGGNNSRNSSRPSSPRVSKGTPNKKSPISSGYDIDDGAGADDERTPLMPSTIRSARSGRNRRPASSMRQLEHQNTRYQQSFFGRFAGCITLSFMILLVIAGAIGFMFATTQPLSEVKIVALRNVLVSQQELMFEMEVSVRNPNVVAVTIDSMNVDVFARSKHAGPDGHWWDWPPASTMRRTDRGLRSRRSVDATEEDDPEWEDPDRKQTLKLGQILAFDSPLSFDGSPFRNAHSRAVGEVHLDQPGNTTDVVGDEGSERWGRTLKYAFDLRVKGVLRYQLPLSSRVRSVSVDQITRVDPTLAGVPDHEGPTT